MEKKIIRVFDNKSKASDRYTIVVGGNVYFIGDNPRAGAEDRGPVGLQAKVLEALAGKDTDRGNEVSVFDLPLEVRLTIGKLLKRP